MPPHTETVERADALAERLFGALELFSVYSASSSASTARSSATVRSRRASSPATPCTAGVDVLGVENDFFRLYRLHP